MRPSSRIVPLFALLLCLQGGVARCEDGESVPGIRNYHLRAVEASGVTADGKGAMTLLRSLLPDPTKDEEIAGLIELLNAEGFAVREAAEVKLMKMGTKALPGLRIARESGEPETAGRAGRLITRIQRNRENMAPAVVGAFALIAHDKPAGAVATVLEVLPQLDDKWAESQGCDLLAEIATLADRAPLEAALEQKGISEPARIAVLQALASILDAGELASLEPYMDADLPEAVQLGAAEALANRGHRPVLAVLVRLLESDDGTSRWRAMNLLKAFTGKEIIGKPYVEKFPKETIEQLEEWLRESGPTVELAFPLKKVAAKPISGFLAASTSNGVFIYDRDGKEVGKIECSPYDAQALPGGQVLVCERSEGRVVVFDRAGKELREVGGISSPTDAELVSNGNLLVLENDTGEILEFDRGGKRVWSVDGLSNAYDVDRLPNGNTIVADSGNSRLVEFDRAGEVVWEKGGLDFPNGVLRMDDGRTLYTTYTSGGIVMLDPAGEKLWERVFDTATLYAIAISNGRIHVADGASGRVLILEMDGANSDAVPLDSSFVDIGYMRE